MASLIKRPFFGERALRLGATVCALVAIGACSSFDRSTTSWMESVTPYKPDVIQGNFISDEQVQALRPGMSKLQVKEILGTPLLASVFHNDRWDYVFLMKRQGVEPQRYKLTAYFNGDLLDRVVNDELPGEEEFIKRIGPQGKTPKVPVLEAKPEQLEKFRQSNPSPAASNATSELPSGALSKDYPPLESTR